MKRPSIIWNQPLGETECPYARRWALTTPIGSLRVHQWWRSDDKRSPHSHPWWFLTLVLQGSYEDWSYPDQTARGAPRLDSKKIDTLKRGSVRFRKANHLHCVSVKKGGCWSILLTGREKNEWGFWVKRPDGAARFFPHVRYFWKFGHHPCDQP